MSVPTHWVASPSELDTTVRIRGWGKSAAAIAEVLFAREGEPPPKARIDWTIAQVQRFADEVGGKAVFAFRLALFAITWLAPLVSFRLPTLRRHDLDTRSAIIHRFERTPLGLSIFAVKAFLCMHYFEHPDVAPEVGFDPEGVGDVG